MTHDPDRFERNFIAGDWVFTREGYDFDIYEPSNSRVIATVPLSSRFDVARAVAAAAAALPDWSGRAGADRSAIVFRALALIEADLDTIATLEARDTGLPVVQARAEIAAALAEGASARPTTSRPAGVVGQILSWSGPFTQACRTLLPALTDGDTAVVKPSLRAPLSLVRFAECLQVAGLPAGVFNLVQGTGIDVGAALAAHPGLTELGFQGARQTGKSVARAAANNETALQPYFRHPVRTIVQAGADLDRTIGDIADRVLGHAARAGYGGQIVQIASSRVDDLMTGLTGIFDAVRYDTASQGQGSIAPMIAETFRDARRTLLERFTAAGAEILYTGPEPAARTARMGWFVPPLILRDDAHVIDIDGDQPLGPTVILRIRHA